MVNAYRISKTMCRLMQKRLMIRVRTRNYKTSRLTLKQTCQLLRTLSDGYARRASRSAPFVRSRVVVPPFIEYAFVPFQTASELHKEENTIICVQHTIANILRTRRLQHRLILVDRIQL